MRRYIDNALYFDITIAFIVGFCLYYGKPIFKVFLSLPTYDNLNNFSVSLITVSATLIGFLLTIITVIVTFKKGFEENNKTKEKEEVSDKVPTQTIFGRKILKEQRFYGTEIHKKVVDVFVNATYEIALVLFSLLLIQFNGFSISNFWSSIINCCILVLLVLTVSRCLYIFRYFLNVHLH